MSFALDYTLHDAGWAEAVVTAGDATVRMTVSYLHDSLHDLATSAIDLVNGATETSAVFMDEPGEHHLIFRRDGESVAIEIRWYDDWFSWGMHPADQFRLVLQTSAARGRVVGEIHKVVDGVFERHGIEDYRRLWLEHDFPRERQLQLHHLISQQRNATHEPTGNA